MQQELIAQDSVVVWTVLLHVVSAGPQGQPEVHNGLTNTAATGAVGGSSAGAGGWRPWFLPTWAEVGAVGPCLLPHDLLVKAGHGVAQIRGRETPPGPR